MKEFFLGMPLIVKLIESKIRKVWLFRIHACCILWVKSFHSIVHFDEDVEIVQKDMQIQIYDTSKENPIDAQTPVKELENKTEQVSNELPKSWKFSSNHPIDQILGEPSSKVMTRSSLRNIFNNVAFVSQYEPKNINEAEQDESWMMAMQEELNQFERNKVWTLVPKSSHHTIIGTKWVFSEQKGWKWCNC